MVTANTLTGYNKNTTFGYLTTSSGAEYSIQNGIQ